jgi:hypothetical protein
VLALVELAALAKRTAAVTGALALASVVVLVSAACSSSAATTTFIPQTGVVVRAETLTSGVGCGTGEAQIWKYAAVAVNDADGTAVAGATYDCFADAVLVNLQPSLADAGVTFTIHVFAYDEAAYTKNAATVASVIARIPDDEQKVVPALDTTAPTYTTTCSVTEEANIQAVASCGALTHGASGK